MDHELKMWLISFGVGTPVAIVVCFFGWFRSHRRIKAKYKNWSERKLLCHVVGCEEIVYHAHWPHDDIYSVQYVCPRHMADMMEEGKTYTVEPWQTELDEAAIKRLVDSRY